MFDLETIYDKVQRANLTPEEMNTILKAWRILEEHNLI
jgi:hypothetical protein